MSWNFEPDHPDQDTFDDFAEDDEAGDAQAEEAEASEVTDASPDQEDLAEDEIERMWDEVECGMMDGSGDPLAEGEWDE